LALLTIGDVPDREPAPVGQYPARFLVEAGLFGHVHLHVLAENDVESRVGEGQLGNVCLTNGNPSIQPDKSVEPAGRFAVVLGQVDGSDPATTLVGDVAGSTTDPAARVEHLVVGCDSDQVDQLGRGNAPHRVKVLEQREV
jgi:hypothetical protein